MRLRTIAVAVIALTLSAGAFGQSNPGNLGGGTLQSQSTTTQRTAPGGPSVLQLLGREDVQSDIQFSGGQRSNLQSIRDKLTRQWSGGSRKASNPTAGRLAMEEQLGQADRQADAMLSNEQRQRVAEIRIQLRGNAIILDPSMQKELGITEVQKSQIAGLLKSQQDGIKSHMQSGDFQRGQMHAVIQRQQQAFNAGLGKLLTEEQAAKLKQMSGKPFRVQTQQ